MVQNTICEFCSKPIVDRGDNGGRRIYCSEDCAKRGNQRKQTEKRRQCNLQARLGLKGGTIGAINESVVAVDLVKRGWHVYTAFEPTHSFDILAVKSSRYVRVEVKTETVLPSGATSMAQKKTQRPGESYDVLAKVQNLSDITYDPEVM